MRSDMTRTYHLGDGEDDARAILTVEALERLASDRDFGLPAPADPALCRSLWPVTAGRRGHRGPSLPTPHARAARGHGVLRADLAPARTTRDVAVAHAAGRRGRSGVRRRLLDRARSADGLGAPGYGASGTRRL